MRIIIRIAAKRIWRVVSSLGKERRADLQIWTALSGVSSEGMRTIGQILTDLGLTSTSWSLGRVHKTD